MKMDISQKFICMVVACVIHCINIQAFEGEPREQAPEEATMVKNPKTAPGDPRYIPNAKVKENQNKANTQANDSVNKVVSRLLPNAKPLGTGGISFESQGTGMQAIELSDGSTVTHTYKDGKITATTINHGPTTFFQKIGLSSARSTTEITHNADGTHQAVRKDLGLFDSAPTKTTMNFHNNGTKIDSTVQSPTSAFNYGFGIKTSSSVVHTKYNTDEVYDQNDLLKASPLSYKKSEGKNLVTTTNTVTYSNSTGSSESKTTKISLVDAKTGSAYKDYSKTTNITQYDAVGNVIAQ